MVNDRRQGLVAHLSSFRHTNTHRHQWRKTLFATAIRFKLCRMDSQVANVPTHTFKGSRFWVSNAQMAAIAGAGAAVLVLVVAVVALSKGGNARMALLFLLISVGTLLCFYFPGNLIVVYPYEVTVEGGKGLWLHGGFKKVCIPIDDRRDVQHTGTGTAVRLKRRHRLLGGFYIHWAFGPEAGPLADAIRDEIRKRNSSEPQHRI